MYHICFQPLLTVADGWGLHHVCRVTGPSVFEHTYFLADDFPLNMPKIWDEQVSSNNSLVQPLAVVYASSVQLLVLYRCSACNRKVSQCSYR
jgi:hypothetical protein